MNQRTTINLPIHYDTHSDDVANGQEIAKEVWFSTGEGASLDAAAAKFSETFSTTALTESPEVLAGMLHGAARFLIDIAGKPEITMRTT